MLVNLQDIKIGKRFREESDDDVTKLVESIKNIGLVHPIVITEQNQLVCGRGRIEAYKILGLSEIETSVISSEVDTVRAEIEENTARKDFTANAIVRIDEYYRVKEESAAKERQNSGRVSENFAKGRSSAKIAAIAGVSDRTLEKIRLLKEAATTNPTVFKPFWDKANSQKISIDKAYRKVKQRLKIEEARKLPFHEEKSSLGSYDRNYELKLGSMQEKGLEIANDSIDLIFTDPPYKEESLFLYDELAKLAQRVLKAGGSLVTFIGHYALFEIGRRIEANSQLTYHWLLIVKHNGRTAKMWKQRVWPRYKPMLWYYKPGSSNGPTMFTDMSDLIESEPPQKIMHPWEQSPKEATHIIESLTVENQIVLDPFMGSGTTGLAALQLGRKFIGIEIDKEHCSNAFSRLSYAGNLHGVD